MLRHILKFFNTVLLKSRKGCKIVIFLVFIQVLYLLLVSNFLDDLLAEEFPKQKLVNKSLEELNARHYLETLINGLFVDFFG